MIKEINAKCHNSRTDPFTNITERSGAAASSTYVASAGRPRNRYVAWAMAHRGTPQEMGTTAGITLSALMILALAAAEVTRRMLETAKHAKYAKRIFTEANQVNKGFLGFLLASFPSPARDLSELPSVKSVRVHPPVLRSFSAKDGCNPWLKLFAYFAYFAVYGLKSSFSLLPSVKEIRVNSRNSRIKLPSLFWRYATYVLIVSLLGSDPRLDFFTLRAYAQCSIPTNPSTDTIRVTNYSYDFDGHLTQVNCPEGVINYGYDLATGRHISTCTTNTYVAYDYDELGRLKSVSLQKQNTTNITAQVTFYTYTEVGNRASVTLPNGVVTSYGYDSLNRLTGLTNSLGGTNLLSSFTYQLHSTGRRTNAFEVLKTEDTEIPWITNNITWSYDQMYRLTNEAVVCSTGTNSYTNSYQYDLVGNRISKTHIQNDNTVTVTSTFNQNDELLTEITFNGGTPTETNSYAYDLNGSLIAKTNISSSSSTVLYGYDLKNKLSNVTTDGTGSTNYFVYDDQGIRVRTSSSSGGNPTLYLIDANNHTGYARILERLSSINSQPSTSYVIGDDVIAQASGATVSWLLYDGHGSTRQLADSGGGVSQRYNYDAYGITQTGTSSGSPSTSILYCGEQFDSTLGMYNLRARFYDPSSGRFNAIDTYAGQSQEPNSLHKYNYCHNDPLNAIDPSGLSFLSKLGWITAGVVVGLVTCAVIAAAAPVVASAVIGGIVAMGASQAAAATIVTVGSYALGALGFGLYVSNMGHDFYQAKQTGDWNQFCFDVGLGIGGIGYTWYSCTASGYSLGSDRARWFNPKYDSSKSVAGNVASWLTTRPIQEAAACVSACLAAAGWSNVGPSGFHSGLPDLLYLKSIFVNYNLDSSLTAEYTGLF